MRRLLFATVGLLALAGLTGSVSAADMGRPIYKAPAPVYYPPVYNWTGLYMGVNGGYGWGTTNWSALGSSFDVSGGLFGGQVGYNWQFGQFVYGVEGDVDWTDIKGNSFVNGAAGCAANVCATKNNFISTARGRVGYAIDRWMPYLTGGLAVGNIETTTPFTTGVNQTKAGWTVGAGLEFALVANWTAKVEYLHVDLGNTSCGGACGFPAGNNVDFTTNIVRAGVNFRF
jgi:outer membrane immunogenic protein